MIPDEGYEPQDPDIMPGDRVEAVRVLRTVQPGALGTVFGVFPPPGKGRISNVAVHWDCGPRMGLAWWANPIGGGWEATIKVVARPVGPRRFKRPRK